MEEAERPLLYPRVVREAASPVEFPLELGLVMTGLAGLVTEIIPDNGLRVVELLEAGRGTLPFCLSERTANIEAARRAEIEAGCNWELLVLALLDDKSVAGLTLSLETVVGI